MIRIVQSAEFKSWLSGLKDDRARVKILIRIERITNGNPGDVASVGHGVMEMRIDHGPGYRVYYVQRGQEFIFLLSGGDKGSQKRDIKRATDSAQKLDEKK